MPPGPALMPASWPRILVRRGAAEHDAGTYRSTQPNDWWKRHPAAYGIIAALLVLIAAACLWVLFREQRQLPILPWRKVDAGSDDELSSGQQGSDPASWRSDSQGDQGHNPGGGVVLPVRKKEGDDGQDTQDVPLPRRGSKSPESSRPGTPTLNGAPTVPFQNPARIATPPPAYPFVQRPSSTGHPYHQQLDAPYRPTSPPVSPISPLSPTGSSAQPPLSPVSPISPTSSTGHASAYGSSSSTHVVPLHARTASNYSDRSVPSLQSATSITPLLQPPPVSVGPDRKDRGVDRSSSMSASTSSHSHSQSHSNSHSTSHSTSHSRHLNPNPRYSLPQRRISSGSMTSPSVPSPLTQVTTPDTEEDDPLNAAGQGVHVQVIPEEPDESKPKPLPSSLGLTTRPEGTGPVRLPQNVNRRPSPIPNDALQRPPWFQHRDVPNGIPPNGIPPNPNYNPNYPASGPRPPPRSPRAYATPLPPGCAPADASVVQQMAGARGPAARRMDAYGNWVPMHNYPVNPDPSLNLNGNCAQVNVPVARGPPVQLPPLDLHRRSTSASSQGHRRKPSKGLWDDSVQHMARSQSDSRRQPTSPTDAWPARPKSPSGRFSMGMPRLPVIRSNSAATPPPTLPDGAQAQAQPPPPAATPTPPAAAPGPGAAI